MPVKVARWSIYFVGIGGMVLFISYYAFKLNKRIETNVVEHKSARNTTGTVVGKEYVKFDEINHFYLDEEGNRIDRQPGDEDWRIYYYIDNFNQIAEPMRSRLLESE